MKTKQLFDNKTWEYWESHTPSNSLTEEGVYVKLDDAVQIIETHNAEIKAKLQECLLPHNIECDGQFCMGCWKDIINQLINRL